jgi:hypothetical protein
MKEISSSKDKLKVEGETMLLTSDVNPVAWVRLQSMATALQARTYTRRWVGCGKRGTLGGYQITVSQDVANACEILGRGTDEQVKVGLHWFATFYPAVYSEVMEVK